VTPIPNRSSSNCSLGSRSRGVNPAACRRRQKSLRGFAKCAAAAAETRPGLIPQKTAVSPGARTSGTSLGGFGFPGIELVLEERPEELAGDGALVPGSPAHDADHLDAVLSPPPVAPGIAFGLTQRSEPLHTRTVSADPDDIDPV
jgi:hypothetical protein